MAVELHKSVKLDHVWIYEMVGHWTWSESFTQFDREIQETREKNERYDVIVDMTKSRDVPNSSLPNFRTMVHRRREVGGKLTIIISQSTFLLVLAPVFRRLYPIEEKSIYIVKTHDQAYDIIRQERAKALNS